LRHLAMEHRRAVGVYRRFCRPGGDEWATYLRRHGGFQAVGEHCSIQLNTVVTDPSYVRIGNNVRLSGCTLFGHDGSVNMLNRAYGCKLDRVGKIDIRDNVYIGHGATVLPGVTIGPNAIVAAGAVVSRDVAENTIAAGVPARAVGHLDEYVEKLKRQTASLPWAHLIERRTHENYWQLQTEIDRLRVRHFFGAEAAIPATRPPGDLEATEAEDATAARA